MLTNILERIYFLYLSFSDNSDPHFYNSKPDNPLRKWEEQEYILTTSDYLRNASVCFQGESESGNLSNTIKHFAEFLGIHFSQGNKKAFLLDVLDLIASTQQEIEDYEEVLDIILGTWSLTVDQLQDNSLKPEWKLRAGHFCQAFRLNREIVLSDLLSKTFQLDALMPLIKPLEKENMAASLAENMSSNHLIENSLVPRLDRLLKEVCQTLRVSESFDFFVANEPVHGASIMPSIISGDRSLITITSELVMNLGDTELKFVIGHEIGHWLFSINDTRVLLNACYDGEENMPSFSLHNLIATWKKLSEFSADRVGLIACGSLDAAINSLYRACTGLDPKMMEFNGKKYIENIDQQIPDSLNLEFFREDFHPPMPVRIKALEIFSKSELYLEWVENFEINMNDKDLSHKMGELIRLLDYTSEDPLHNRRMLAITIGGFILAGIDNEIHQDEIEKIRDVLYQYVLDADFIISYVGKLIEEGADLFSMLRDTLVDLVVANEEEKYDLMEVFIQVALSDGILKREETDLLVQIGSFLNIDSEKTLRVIALYLGKGFFFEKQVPDSVFDLLERRKPFHSGSNSQRVQLASDKKTRPIDLVQLASDADPYVRYLVLCNESTPEKTRMELLDSPSLKNVIEEESENHQED